MKSLALLAIAAALSLNGPAAGVTLPNGVELERLADESYQPPGVPGEIFIIEQTFPVVCGGKVLFTGVSDVNVNAAIYAASSAGIEVVANLGTPIPGTPWFFTRAQRAACVWDRVFFAGGGGVTDPAARGIFAWTLATGEIELLLSSALAFPTLEFLGFDDVSFDLEADGPGFAVTGPTFQLGSFNRDALAFERFGNAPPQLLAEGYTTLLPGHEMPPVTLTQPLMRGSDVIFKATFPFPDGGGLYRWSPAAGFTPIADTTTVYPQVGSNFAGFGLVIDLDAGLVFDSLFSGGLGVFLARDDGEIVPFVVPGDRTREGEVLIAARNPSGAGALLTFTGRTAENPFRDAIFVRRPDGVIQRILGTGDVIEGRLVSGILSGADDRDVGIWTQSTTGGFPNAVIYRASFGDGIAVDVPGPSPAALAILFGWLGAAGWLLLSRGGGGPA